MFHQPPEKTKDNILTVGLDTEALQTLFFSRLLARKSPHGGINSSGLKLHSITEISGNMSAQHTSEADFILHLC